MHQWIGNKNISINPIKAPPIIPIIVPMPGKMEPNEPNAVFKLVINPPVTEPVKSRKVKLIQAMGIRHNIPTQPLQQTLPKPILIHLDLLIYSTIFNY